MASYYSSGLLGSPMGPVNELPRVVVWLALAAIFVILILELVEVGYLPKPMKRGKFSNGLNSWGPGMYTPMPSARMRPEIQGALGVGSRERLSGRDMAASAFWQPSDELSDLRDSLMQRRDGSDPFDLDGSSPGGMGENIHGEPDPNAAVAK